MIKLITTNWSFFRVLRLLMGLFIVGQAIVTKDLFFGVAGFVFTLMPLFNQGCCGIQNSCQNKPTNKNSTKAIEYEELV